MRFEDHAEDKKLTILNRLRIWVEVDTWITQYRAYTNCTIEEAVYVFVENDGLTPLEVMLKSQGMKS